MSIFSSLKIRWAASDIPQRFYMLATYLTVIPLVTLAYTRDVRLINVSGILPLGCCLTGFLIWSLPKLRRLLHSFSGKVLFIACQAMFLPPTVGLANQVVGASLKLPPQSFATTVGLLTVLSYPIVWGVVLSTIVFVTGCVSIAGAPIVGSMIPMFKPLHLRWRSTTNSKTVTARLGDGLDAKHQALSNHGMGAFLSALLALSALAYYCHMLYSPKAIRLAAYFLDFTEASDYPGQSLKGKIRLLDNGYVAYANREGFLVDVKVAKDY